MGVFKCSGPSLSVSVNGNNQISSSGFSYDADGDMTGDALYSYAFNGANEITSANDMNYTGACPERSRRDGDALYASRMALRDGQRVEKSNGKLYWYGQSGELLDETDGSGNVTNEYVYFGGKRIAWRDSSGNIHYYAEDFLGNSRVVMTSAGTVCYDADFYPYGGERVVTDSCDQSFKFTGKERDPETGNDYFGARFYSSSFGRFLSPDWSATVEPVPYAKLDNPQSLNLYLYVRDNPESVFDPDGHLQHKAAGHQLVMQPCNGIGDGPCTWTKQTIVAPPNAPPAGAAQQQNMSLSQKGLAFIERHEGYSSTVYKDSAGNPTIGYGHLIQKGEDFSKGITKDQASALLAQDVKGAVGAVNADLMVAVSQTKFDALVDFAYNLGGKNLANSTLLSNINSGKAVIESNFTSYNHAGGIVVPGLRTRRTDEFNLFSSGDYGGP